MFGDAVHTTDFFQEQFGMNPEHSQALQAVHGAVHQAEVGVKYTWYGSGYISNMYFKWMSNKPTFKFDKGGDLSLVEVRWSTSMLRAQLVDNHSLGPGGEGAA